MFRFIHAADIHLDSPLRGLERYDGAPVDEIRQATRRALQNLVRLAIDEQVAFLLIAGDLYDGDWPDHNTGLFFVSQMARLGKAGIPVFLIAGNHDAANRMTASLPLPANVCRLPHEAPHSVTLAEAGGRSDLDVVVHGQSFASRVVSDNVVRNYPAARGGFFNIGLLHTSLEAPEGDHARYAPCSQQDLVSRGYDYWALGHIHAHQTVRTEPHIVFSGNVQGRHIREPGPKGCVLVEVDQRHAIDARFKPLDVFRWETCRIDAAGAADGDAVLARLHTGLEQLLSRGDGLPLAVRVEVSGRCRAHRPLSADPLTWTQRIRAAAMDVADCLWIEKVKLRTSPELSSDDLAADGPLGEMLDYLSGLEHDETSQSLLLKEVDSLRQRLPRDVFSADEVESLFGGEALRQRLAEIEALLVERLADHDAQTEEETA